MSFTKRVLKSFSQAWFDAGTFITRAFIRLRATINGEAKIVRIALLAEQYDSFRDYRTDELPSFFIDTPQVRYYNKTRIRYSKLRPLLG